MKLGIIEEGKLKGCRIILQPRGKLKKNEWYVSSGKLAGGAYKFSKACLICEDFMPDQGCEHNI